MGKMPSFKMSWPDLGLGVTCDEVSENRAAFGLFVANLPIKAVQGHEMTGGWILRDHSIIFRKKPFGLDEKTLSKQTMDKIPVGGLCFLFPEMSCAELLVKYDESVDDREYIPFARVREGDLGALKEAGKLQWKSATRTKEIIVVEFAA
jgi:hypothetical protein